MTLEHSLGPERGPSPPPAACTIGVFDGVHRGHQQLLARTVAAAREIGGIAVAVTFEPHPSAVLDPGNVPPELTTLDEKRERLIAAGIDRVVVVNFTREVSQWSAERFCERLLDRFDLRHLVVGAGFALGRARRGDVDFLRGFGEGGCDERSMRSSRSMPNTSESSVAASRFDLPLDVAAETAASASAAISSS